MNPTCVSCRWWDPEWTERHEHSPGRCRRRAPWMALRVSTSETYGMERGRFPEARGTDWCGEHQQVVECKREGKE